MQHTDFRWPKEENTEVNPKHWFHCSVHYKGWTIDYLRGFKDLNRKHSLPLMHTVIKLQLYNEFIIRSGLTS